MDTINRIHYELTSLNSSLDYKDIIYRFAKELGWNPSYYMSPSMNEDFANGFLSIENGLENTAVLAFLKKPFNDLSYGERKALYSVSYNNLVPWLISIDKNRITYSYILNSTEKGIVEEVRIDGHSYEMLRSEAFETIIGKRPSPNIKALDDSLIDNISRWRRLVSAELNNDIETVVLSAFFNAIIFIRALEDNNKRYGNIQVDNEILLKCLPCQDIKTHLIFSEAAKILGQHNVPDHFINHTLLKKLDTLDFYTFKSIFNSFYQSLDGYNYDFSIISKHALSRVYEKYVAGLQIESPEVLTLFENVPVEINKRTVGTFYTPEYIARFFAKYALKEIPYSSFDSIKILEPAVGSGIFMRTLLELLAEKGAPFFDDKQIKSAFSNIVAIDVDANACQATNLSLALLYLLLYSEFPQLNILNEESIQYLSSKNEYKNHFNLIISNPPYIRYEYLPKELKDFLKEDIEFSKLSKGKIDLYLAFLKISVDLLAPGGIALFIIPHSFLINEGAKKIKKYIYEKCNIKLLADLSTIPVFGNTGTYSILFVFEKKTEKETAGITTILKCKNYVGQALEDVLESKEVDNKHYSIYTVNSKLFNSDNWLILPNKEYDIEQKLSRHTPINHYLYITSGIITGGDGIFIRNKKDIPQGEESIYKPYLGDREKKSYITPTEVDKYIFYHYTEDGELITEEILKRDYPKTWKYLNDNEVYLRSRKSQPSQWWMIRSIIHPQNIFTPKIITPELTITPKFSLDVEGKYVVSHSSYLKLKESFASDIDLLFYFLGILNSTPCYWYIANHSNKYGGSYNKIQPKTLKNTPIPDPYKQERNKLITFIKMVKERMLSSGIQAIELDRRIDLYVCDFYQLTKEEQSLILGDYDNNESE